jgi:hypothetical protein
MNPQAVIALRAARNVKQWGVAAAMLYCTNRGVPLGLFTLARQLGAVS